MIDSMPVVGREDLPEVLFDGDRKPTPIKWGRLRPWKGYPVPEDMPF